MIGGKGWEAADDWAALVAAAVIAFNGAGMFRRALGEVMDTAVPANFEHEVRALALAVPGVRALDKCRVRRSGLSHLPAEISGQAPVWAAGGAANRCASQDSMTG